MSENEKEINLEDIFFSLRQGRKKNIKGRKIQVFHDLGTPKF